MGRWIGGVFGNTVGSDTPIQTTTGVFSSADQYYMKQEGGWALVDGSTVELAAPSAKAIYDLGSDYQGASANGYYWLDPGGTGNYKQQYYCRMDHGGGWVAVAFIMREEFGADNQYALSTANNRGTYPASSPYIVPAIATKCHNDAISPFEGTYDGNYWMWFDHWSYTGSYPDTANSNTNWPAPNATVATGHDGSAPTAASGYANESDFFKHTRSLSGAFAGAGGNGTMLFGNGVSSHTNVAQHNWDNNGGKRFADVNKNDRNMDSSQSQVYDFVDAAYTSSATAYSTLCDDDATGPYQMARDYNCYHQYLIIYVR